jgi:hypothetical protein
MNQEPSPTDLMNAILELSSATAQGFARVDSRFMQSDARMDRVETRLTSVEGEVRGMRVELRDVKSDVSAMRVELQSMARRPKR